MLKNYKEVKDSRLDLKDEDYKFFMDQTGLSRAEVERIFKIFDEKGGVLNKKQFKQAFDALNRNWLSNYKNGNEISDLVFRSFDKDQDGVLELKEFMLGCACFFLSKGDPQTKLEYIFDFYDANHDGYLSLQEIREGYKAVFAMLGTENVDLLCKAMAEDTMSELALDSEKKIPKDKFIKILMEDKNISEKLNMLF